jgi:hypothetical protein
MDRLMRKSICLCATIFFIATIIISGIITLDTCLLGEAGMIDMDHPPRGEYYVSVTGNDNNPGTAEKPWRHIQKAARRAKPGSTVFVKEGVYKETITVSVSGNKRAGFITFQPIPGHLVVIDGSGEETQQDRSSNSIIYMSNKKYVRIQGFEICHARVNDGSGIRMYGSAEHIQILDNIIHDIKGTSAMGITVYGTGSRGIRDLVIRGNEVYDCEPAPSEAVTLNGNVKDFEMTGNTVHHVNNIGIDMIGGERWLSTYVVRDGLCSGNTVYNARSSYGDGYAAGIYVDGGNTIVIERNRVFECDMGIEVGAENNGVTVANVILRNNLVYHNDKAGIALGAFSLTGGRVTGCTVLNNTVYQNNRVKAEGEIWLQHVSNSGIYNNIVSTRSDASRRVVLVSSIDPLRESSIRLDYNVYYVDNDNMPADIFLSGRDTFPGISEYKQETGQDTHSLFSNPEFLTLPGSITDGFMLSAGSPAHNAGMMHHALGNVDYYGNQRVQGSAVDIGAVEQQSDVPD